MLVTYHVVGSDGSSGIQVPADHPIRLFVDFLIDIRMPLFAAIAGFVYALKPVPAERLLRFQTGKLRRLAIPGMVAITLFALASHLAEIRFAPAGPWWQIYLFSYAHYWFLQAILIIFLVYCSFDILTGGRWLLPTFLLSVLWYLTGIHIPTSFLSIDDVFYLLPYFIFGIVLYRHRQTLDRHALPILGVMLTIAIAATLWNLRLLDQTGSLSTDRRDLQSAAFGLAMTSILLRWTPPIRALAGFGPLSFTIYLYHVFGTSAMRRLLDMAGIETVMVLIPLGIIAGFAVPWAIHRLAALFPLGRLLVLGQSLSRRKPAGTGSAAAPAMPPKSRLGP